MGRARTNPGIQDAVMHPCVSVDQVQIQAQNNETFVHLFYVLDTVLAHREHRPEPSELGVVLDELRCDDPANRIGMVAKSLFLCPSRADAP